MKKFIIASTLLTAVLMAGGNVTPVAQVDMKTGMYIGGGVTFSSTYAEDSKIGDVIGGAVGIDRAMGVSALVGYEFYQAGNFTASVEGRVGYTGYNADLDYWTVAAYLKPEYMVTDRFSVYGLVGYGAQFDADTTDNKRYGLSYGAGVAYRATSDVKVFADVTDFTDVWGDTKGAGMTRDTARLTIGAQYSW